MTSNSGSPSDRSLYSEPTTPTSAETSLYTEAWLFDPSVSGIHASDRPKSDLNAEATLFTPASSVDTAPTFTSTVSPHGFTYNPEAGSFEPYTAPSLTLNPTAASFEPSLKPQSTRDPSAPRFWPSSYTSSTLRPEASIFVPRTKVDKVSMVQNALALHDAKAYAHAKRSFYKQAKFQDGWNDPVYSLRMGCWDHDHDDEVYEYSQTKVEQQANWSEQWLDTIEHESASATELPAEVQAFDSKAAVHGIQPGVIRVYLPGQSDPIDRPLPSQGPAQEREPEAQFLDFSQCQSEQQAQSCRYQPQIIVRLSTGCLWEQYYDDEIFEHSKSKFEDEARWNDEWAIDPEDISLPEVEDDFEETLVQDVAIDQTGIESVIMFHIFDDDATEKVVIKLPLQEASIEKTLPSGVATSYASTETPPLVHVDGDDHEVVSEVVIKLPFQEIATKKAVPRINADKPSVAQEDVTEQGPSEEPPSTDDVNDDLLNEVVVELPGEEGAIEENLDEKLANEQSASEQALPMGKTAEQAIGKCHADNEEQSHEGSDPGAISPKPTTSCPVLTGNKKPQIPTISSRASACHTEWNRQKHLIDWHRDVYDCPTVHHFSFTGDPVWVKSSTRPATSLAVIMSSPKYVSVDFAAKDIKVYNLHQHVLLSMAWIWVDPVVFTGPPSILKLRGSELENAAMDHTAKAYPRNGLWQWDQYGEDEYIPEVDRMQGNDYDDDEIAVLGYFNDAESISRLRLIEDTVSWRKYEFESRKIGWETRPWKTQLRSPLAQVWTVEDHVVEEVEDDSEADTADDSTIINQVYDQSYPIDEQEESRSTAMSTALVPYHKPVLRSKSGVSDLRAKSTDQEVAPFDIMPVRNMPDFMKELASLRLGSEVKIHEGYFGAYSGLRDINCLPSNYTIPRSPCIIGLNKVLRAAERRDPIGIVGLTPVNADTDTLPQYPMPMVVKKKETPPPEPALIKEEKTMETITWTPVVPMDEGEGVNETPTQPSTPEEPEWLSTPPRTLDRSPCKRPESNTPTRMLNGPDELYYPTPLSPVKEEDEHKKEFDGHEEAGESEQASVRVAVPSPGYVIGEDDECLESETEGAGLPTYRPSSVSFAPSETTWFSTRLNGTRVNNTPHDSPTRGARLSTPPAAALSTSSAVQSAVFVPCSTAIGCQTSTEPAQGRVSIRDSPVLDQAPGYSHAQVTPMEQIRSREKDSVTATGTGRRNWFGKRRDSVGSWWKATNTLKKRQPRGSMSNMPTDPAQVDETLIGDVSGEAVPPQQQQEQCQGKERKRDKVKKFVKKVFGVDAKGKKGRGERKTKAIWV